MRFTVLLPLLLFSFQNAIYCQNEKKENNRSWYIEPEFMVGKLVANYEHFPSSNYQSSIFINIGSVNYSSTNSYSGFYNYPSTGISTSFSSFGNDSLLGKEFSLIPFLEINTSRYKSSSFCFKFGLGASYFTEYYNKKHNKTNKAIGSNLTWAFQLFLYYKLNITNNLNVKLGAGYLHCSNGHTQLPNYGLNSGMVSLSTQYFLQPMQQKPKYEPNLTHHYFISTRSGIGFHEYGASKGPAGGPKKMVYTQAFSGGIIFKQNISIHAGLACRYYQHYYEHIISDHRTEYYNNPRLKASNVYFFLGSEFLISHLSIDIEGGINLYKPFEDRNIDAVGGFKYWLKRVFPSRMGLKLYAFNTATMPKNNIYLSAHINANFGQADFSELSIGYVRLLK